VNHLFRELAPITEAGWEAIEEESGQTLRTYLAGRKLVDFSGPHGWEESAVDLGRVEAVKSPQAEVGASVRKVQPIVELRTAFTVARTELDTLHDELYVLACAVNDAERDLTAAGARPTAAELREIVDWLLEAARPLRDRELTPPA
jgi:uncharacterized linocin/CFP29 family protein